MNQQHSLPRGVPMNQNGPPMRSKTGGDLLPFDNTPQGRIRREIKPSELANFEETMASRLGYRPGSQEYATLTGNFFNLPIRAFWVVFASQIGFFLIVLASIIVLSINAGLGWQHGKFNYNTSFLTEVRGVMDGGVCSDVGNDRVIQELHGGRQDGIPVVLLLVAMSSVLGFYWVFCVLWAMFISKVSLSRLLEVVVHENVGSNQSILFSMSRTIVSGYLHFAFIQVFGMRDIWNIVLYTGVVVLDNVLYTMNESVNRKLSKKNNRIQVDTENQGLFDMMNNRNYDYSVFITNCSTTALWWTIFLVYFVKFPSRSQNGQNWAIFFVETIAAALQLILTFYYQYGMDWFRVEKNKRKMGIRGVLTRLESQPIRWLILTIRYVTGIILILTQLMKHNYIPRWDFTASYTVFGGDIICVP